ncbi:MAG: polynucleotide adenylyltransferase PcnB [Planctomycetota bacterium]
MSEPDALAGVGATAQTFPLPINPQDLDADAVKIMRRLRRHGFEAYLVGGSTRDLLLGRRPKDFDVATSARPRQIKRLFRNSRIIGRRFKLVHVTFGRKIIEVSTYRRCPEVDDAIEGDPLIVRDNTFGTRQEDALRRDFTINGLFYDVDGQQVLDYTGGRRDLAEGVIRTIGDPRVRVREDPVRIIRAVKFATRLGMTIDPELYASMVTFHAELAKTSPPRLLEEFLKLLSDGASSESFRILFEIGVLDFLLPEVTAWIRASGKNAQPERLRQFLRRLAVVDRIDRGRRSLPTALYLAVVFAGPALEALEAEQQREPSAGWQDAGNSVDTVIRPFAQRFRLSRFDAGRCRATLVTQKRFSPGSRGKKRRRRVPLRAFVRRDYFDDAFLLYRILREAEGREAEVKLWEERIRAALSEPVHPRPSGDPRRKQRRGQAGRRELPPLD